MDIPAALEAHLRTHLGAWPPPTEGITIVPHARRDEPGWDGRVRDVIGVWTSEGGVLSVSPRAFDRVSALGDEPSAIAVGLASAMDRPESTFSEGVFRWTSTPTPGDDPGVWTEPDDPRIPAWLRPFNGGVLVGFEGESVAAAVGVKAHDRFGHEVAVVTEEGFRGRGWATRLVSQAARRILDEGAVPLYLHAPANEASARTAEAVGFPDRGWRIVGLWRPHQ